MFFIEAKEKIEKSGTDLNEAKEGQLVVVNGVEQPQTSSGNRRPKKKK